MSQDYMDFIEIAGHYQIITVAGVIANEIDAASGPTLSFNSIRSASELIDNGINPARSKNIVEMLVSFGLLTDTGRLRGLGASEHMAGWLALDDASRARALDAMARGEDIAIILTPDETATTPIAPDANTTAIASSTNPVGGDRDVAPSPDTPIQNDSDPASPGMGTEESGTDDEEPTSDEGASEASTAAEMVNTPAWDAPGTNPHDDADTDEAPTNDDYTALPYTAPTRDGAAAPGKVGEIEASNDETYDRETIQRSSFTVSSGSEWVSGESSMDADTTTVLPGESSNPVNGAQRSFSPSFGVPGNANMGGSADWNFDVQAPTSFSDVAEDAQDVENFLKSLDESNGEPAAPPPPASGPPPAQTWADNAEIDNSAFEKTSGWGQGDETDPQTRTTGRGSGASSSGGARPGSFGSASSSQVTGWNPVDNTPPEATADDNPGWGQPPPPPPAGGGTGWGDTGSGSRWTGANTDSSGASGWGDTGNSGRFDPTSTSSGGWARSGNSGFHAGSSRGNAEGSSGGDSWNAMENNDADDTPSENAMADFLSAGVNNLPGTNTDTGNLGDWLQDDYSGDVPAAWQQDLDRVTDYVQQNDTGTLLTLEELEGVVQFLQERLQTLRDKGLDDEKGLSVRFELQLNELIDEIQRRNGDEN